MNIKQIAQYLGSRGGRARAKSLSSEQKKQIASRAGCVRWLSKKAVERIKTNLNYADAVRVLYKLPSVKSVTRVTGPLPGMNHGK